MINKKRAALWGVIALGCGIIGGCVGHYSAQAVEPTEEVIELSSDYAYTDYKSLGEFVITHYCPCEKCCGKSDGITASGTKATEGRTIAADPDVLPMGSVVIIDGHTYTVEDVGGAIKGKRIDIFMESHQEALEAGVKVAEVYEEV